MAYWVKDRKEIKDTNRTDGNGVMETFECDETQDVSMLPRFNGNNQGSSVLILETGTLYILGTKSGVGINGWRQI
jgi:hypothetical protein